MALNDNSFVMSVNNQNNLIENKGSLPVADSNEINGGRMIVDTTADRNRIRATKRKAGMEVFVLETQTPYILRTNDISKEVTVDDDWTILKSSSALSSDRLSTARTINGVPFDGTTDIELPAEFYTAREIVEIFDNGKITLKRAYDLLLPRFATRISNMISDERSTLGEDNSKNISANVGDTLRVDTFDLVKSIKTPLYQTSYTTTKINDHMRDYNLILTSDQGSDVPLGTEFPAAISSTYTLRDTYTSGISLSCVFESNRVTYFNILRRRNMSEALQEIRLTPQGTSSFNITVAFKINSGNLEDSIAIFVAIPYKTTDNNVAKFQYKYAKLTKNNPGSLVYEGRMDGITGSYYDFLNNTDGELDNFAVPITIISKDSEVSAALKAL
jgi:hypothetical protein|uniref:Uncharacterized protein n=1 Tax=Myoviridae sp. ctIty1 TaxID=2827673 RepID=A0A8S5TGA2_9CAUD|nr:MAG TPA: hypothetical protein [Myoviridae sp. ctIty1]